MREHYWWTHWQGHEYVMDDNGRLIRTTDEKGSGETGPA